MNKALTYPLENLNLAWSALVIDELIKNDITQFYIAPGMRNAPIIASLSAAKKTKNINLEIVMDERSLSFRALGYSKASGLPSVLICTSGTALANFLPAVIEAKRSHVPLVILTADRPLELINSDDNQTIEQTHFYRPWVNSDLNLGAPTVEIKARALTTSVSHLVFKSLFPVKGPVHMNMMFREPLTNTKLEFAASYLSEVESILNQSEQSTNYQIPNLHLTENALNEVLAKIDNAKRGLLVIGALPNTIDKDLFKNFIKKLNFSFYLEVGSSLKYSFNLNDHQVPTFDHQEVQEALKKDPPDLVIHLGGRVTSKFYYQFLEQNPKTNLYVFNATEDKEDPTHLTKKRFIIDLDATIKQLFQSIKNNRRDFWDFKLESFTKKKIDFIETAELSFPVISKTFVDKMPNNLQVYLGNSTTIRTFDSYFSFDTIKDFEIFSNRGVSGIEGFIAGSLGVIDATKKDVYLVIGDVSFIHDFNSLFMINHGLSAKIKIILINNGGGAIFTLLPIKKDREVLDIITSPHGFNFQGVKELNPMINYQSISKREELASALLNLTKSNQHEVLEITIDDATNLAVYDQLKTIR